MLNIIAEFFFVTITHSKRFYRSPLRLALLLAVQPVFSQDILPQESSPALINQVQSFSKSETFEHIRYLSFAGGGGRGYAYFPALKLASEKYGLKLENLKGASGTSAGAVAALLVLLSCDFDKIESIYLEIPKKNFGDFSWTNIFFFNTRMGIYNGDELRNWLINHIFRQTGLIDPTFEELFERIPKDFRVYATNLTKGTLVEYSHLTQPQESVVRSILVSCALPIAFKPKKSQTGDTLIDGGLLKNHPIDAFDFYDDVGTRFANPATLGFYAQADNAYSENAQSSQNVVNYINAILETLTHHESKSLAQCDRQRTIVIPCPKSLTLTSFKLAQNCIEELEVLVDKALENFAAEYRHVGDHTALWAIKRDYADIFDQLLVTEANDILEYRDHLQQNSLMIAIAQGRPRIVEKILSYEPDLLHQNSLGQSAYDLALISKSTVILSLLEEVMGQKLAQAVREQDLDMISLVLKAGGRLDFQLPGENLSLLEDLIASNQLDFLRSLNQKGLLPTLKRQQLFVAFSRSDWTTFRFICQKYYTT